MEAAIIVDVPRCKEKKLENQNLKNNLEEDAGLSTFALDSSTPACGIVLCAGLIVFYSAGERTLSVEMKEEGRRGRISHDQEVAPPKRCTRTGSLQAPFRPLYEHQRRTQKDPYPIVGSKHHQEVCRIKTLRNYLQFAKVTVAAAEYLSTIIMIQSIYRQLLANGQYHQV
jgi:hypothetical protein